MVQEGFWAGILIETVTILHCVFFFPRFGKLVSMEVCAYIYLVDPRMAYNGAVYMFRLVVPLFCDTTFVVRR